MSMNSKKSAGRWGFQAGKHCCAGLLSLGCGFGLASQTQAASDERPNVVFLFADDLGYADTGVTGSGEIPTPHLDRLAREGVVCTSGYVTAPQCGPSRAGLLTGRYQARFGYEWNRKAQDDPIERESDIDLGPPLSERYFPEYLQQTGYVTGAIGKWHMGFADPLLPQSRGFDDYWGFLNGGHDYLKVSLKDTADPTALYKLPLISGRQPVDEKEYLTTALGREASAFIQRHREEPFFLYVAFNAPHVPLQATNPLLQRVNGIEDPDRRTYAAMIIGLDDAIGRIMATLDEEGLADNTLVIFTNDNGGPRTKSKTSTNIFSSNAPFRGYKGDLWEGGIRVPWIMRWPARWKGGQTNDAPISTLDVAPTLLKLAGFTGEPSPALDGVDFVPLIEGKDSGQDRMLFFRFHSPLGRPTAVRQGAWKLIREQGDEPELYNLSSDPGESQDVAATNPELVERLASALNEWESQMMPPPQQFSEGKGKASGKAGANKQPKPVQASQPQPAGH